MKNTLRQVFHSSKFLTGFLIFAAILLTMWIYPLFNPGNPLEMIGVGTFAQPGTYFSLYDAATPELRPCACPTRTKSASPIWSATPTAPP